MSTRVAEFAPRRDHISTLDGLRAVAVLMVLWAHIPRSLQPLPLAKLDYILQPGYFGVDLFFVLSGFLITRILLVDRAAGRPLSQFLVKRCLRIFPIYFLVVGVMAIVAYGPYIKWCALYLSNYYFALTVPLPATPLNHTWSLAVEEHYYLIWPALVFLCPPRVVRALAAWVIPLLAVAAAFMTVFWFMKPERALELVYRGTQYRMFSLAIGGAVACYEPLFRGHTARTFALSAGLAVVGMVIYVGFGLSPAMRDVHIVTKQVAFGLLSVGVLLGALALAETRLRSVLANPVMAYIGRISYGLYLYHYIVYFYLGVLPLNDGSAPPGVTLSRVMMAIAATFAVATVSFYVIERPILRYKDRMYKPSAPPARTQ
ncbi:MAG TPA: acyltransferase [Phycisphaerales bacterium]|nr:acyltransferase [Phycisphaerales bacterium]